MSSHVRVLEQQNPTEMHEAFRRDVLEGLSNPSKRIASRYFYDDEGSRIFQEIMDLEEYYPTDCEREILLNSRAHIGELLGDEEFRLVELGAGDGRKTHILLDYFAENDYNFEYSPIDISEGAMIELVDNVIRRFPDIRTTGLVCEYNHGLRFLREDKKRNVVLFLGSSIGNFTFEQSHRFCRSLRDMLSPGDLVIIGFDLRKDTDVLIPAYSDPHGVTERFNLNLLSRINRELGGNFDVDAFKHFATYNVHSGAMESYLISREAQTVDIDALERSFDFRPWEAIHTEYSWKYLPEDVEDLARQNEFAIVDMLYDSRRYFLNSIWEAD